MVSRSHSSTPVPIDADHPIHFLNIGNQDQIASLSKQKTNNLTKPTRRKWISNTGVSCIKKQQQIRVRYQLVIQLPEAI